MTAADEIDAIRLAKNATRTVTLGLFTISIVVAFILTLAKYPEAEIIEFISNIIYGAIIMLIVYLFLLMIYISAKKRVEETVKEPEENKDDNDG